MTPANRTRTSCLVCGSTEVRTDEVIDHGVVLLAECPRCQYLWTVRVSAVGHRVASPSDAAGVAA
ncbi:MAG: hypothetical protein JRH10_07480 [Deltaproteobacteria bacterium]|nr:hypothetical protein [Deltaproteobacteria bacterium]MBW2445758.1 hypothetical protein [Deltaproteobacteria bacterium]